jgi:hypothetical protein
MRESIIDIIVQATTKRFLNTISGISNIKMGSFLVGALAGILCLGPVMCEFFVLGCLFLLMVSMCFLRFPKETIIALGVLLVLQPLLVSNINKVSPVAGTLVKRSEELFIILFFLLMVVGRMLKQESLIDKRIGLPLLGICVAGVLSSVINGVPFIVSAFGLFLMIKGFLLFAIVESLHWDEASVKKWVKTFGALALILLACGIIDFLVPVQFRRFLGNMENPIMYKSGMPSVVSLCVHPGDFGWMMAVAGIFSLAFYVFVPDKRNLIYSSIFFVGMLFSFRVKPILGVAGALGITFLVYSKTRKYLWKGLVILLIVYILSFNLIWPVITYKIGGFFWPEEGTENIRKVLYLTSFEIARDYFPFGVGLGRYAGWISSLYYSPVYEQYGLSTLYGLSAETGSFIMDTQWANILGELGMLGFIAYVVLCRNMLQRVWAYLKSADTVYLGAFSFGAFMVFMEAMFESIAYPIFQRSEGIYFVFGTMGIVWSLASTKTWTARNKAL